jgi:hypothetical protein
VADDPRVEGIDDLDPLVGVVLVPVPTALAALGVAYVRVERRLRRRAPT